MVQTGLAEFIRLWRDIYHDRPIQNGLTILTCTKTIGLEQATMVSSQNRVTQELRTIWVCSAYPGYNQLYY